MLVVEPLFITVPVNLKVVLKYKHCQPCSCIKISGFLVKVKCIDEIRVYTHHPLYRAANARQGAYISFHF